MLLKPLALTACLVLPLGSAWAQGVNPSASNSPETRSGHTGPAAGDTLRPSGSQDKPKVGGPSANQGTVSKEALDSAIGHGTGRADEDASAAAAR